MLTAPESSASRITSSPSLSPQTHPSTSRLQTTFIDLQQTKKAYSSTLIKLILRVKKLEKQVKTSKARRRVRIVLSEDEDEDAEIQEKISDDTEVLLEEQEPTEIVEDQGSGEKGEKEVSTIGVEHNTVILEVSTANIAVTTIEVSTGAENLVYIRRSVEKKKR
ncbi:hypothetical protein Tco_0166031 [Tanacetum coccineum]